MWSWFWRAHEQEWRQVLAAMESLISDSQSTQAYMDFGLLLGRIGLNLTADMLEQNKLNQNWTEIVSNPK